MVHSLSTKTQSKSRRWNRQQLLQRLEILSTFSPPLPFDLPPSPQQNMHRVGSSLKRKSEHTTDIEHVKRARTSASSTNALTAPHPQHVRSHGEDAQTNDGSQVASTSRVTLQSSTTTATPSTAVLASAVPIRRPKRGRLFPRFVDALHEQYHKAGRTLKYSGDARFWSTYPATHKEYRPLVDPPPPNSPYHKHGGLIARLELVDALICFTYSIWTRDYHRRQCNKETWGTIEGFLFWCKTKWQAEEGINDAEKAFVGLIWMIEGFIHGRKMAYSVKGTTLDNDVERLLVKAKTIMEVAASPIGENSGSSGGGKNSQATPPMLPSPASIATGSANSTPASRADGTPNSSTQRSAAGIPNSQRKPSEYVSKMLLNPRDPSIPQPLQDAMAAVTVPVNGLLLNTLREQTGSLAAVGYSMISSQATLNLSVMARYFPNTFARMAYSSLSPMEEHEPDFEDEEGELFWPGQAVTGEGLGWVCLMGKAMINEFGKAYGYKGLDGVVHKPTSEETDSTPR